VALRVHPGARRAGLVGRMADGTLKVSVAAPPEGGRANQAVVLLVSKALGLRPSHVKLVHGFASRSKVVEVEGLASGEVQKRLDAAMRQGGD
jgi:uncharacterized protein YggU (UPF0235/DUF167 family)